MKKKYFLTMLIASLLLSVVHVDANNNSESNPIKNPKGKVAYGYVIYAGGTSGFGISSFDITKPDEITRLHTPSYYSSAGAVVDEYMYCDLYAQQGLYNVPVSFSKININDGTSTVISNSTPSKTLFTDMTYDYNTRKMYYIAAKSATQSELGTVSLEDGKTTVIGNIPLYLATLACDNGGQLFSIATNGNLYKLNKSNAIYSIIGSVGETVRYYQSMDFDRDSGELYWAGCDNGSNSFFSTVNIETGLSTRIGKFQNNSEITGLYIPFTLTVAGAPAAVTNLTITTGTTAVDAFSSKIEFNAPTLNFGGEALSSINTIEIFRNETSIKVFQSPAIGSKLTYTDNVIESNLYTYKVIATNSVGAGTSTSQSIFVGEDRPNAPSNVVLTKEGNNAILNWVAPTKGINDGWIDVSHLKYEISRLPDNIIVANNVTATSYTDNTIAQGQLGKYSYKVMAKTNIGDSESAISNTIIIGSAFQVPYSYTFDSEETFDLWTIIDVNNDSKTWRLGTDNVKYEYHSTNNGDDWLISPPILLQSGMTYKLKFNAKSQVAFSPESLNVYYGQGTTIDSQILLGNYPALEDEYVLREIIITPIISGEYNFGFHAYSKADSYSLYLSSVEVEAVLDNDLSALSIDGPILPMVDKEYSYSVNIYNNGRLTQNNYNVQLVAETGNVLASISSVEPIAAGETKSINVKWTPTAMGSMFIQAQVVLTNDQLPTNDKTAPLTIDVQKNSEQEWVVIGTGSELDLNMPVSLYFNSSTSQSIYLDDEIRFGGVINKIYYKYINGGNELTKPIKLYMSSTPLKNLSSGWVPKEQLTLVFEGDITLLQGEGELEIGLTMPFVHTGGNLCIMGLRPLDTETFNNVNFISSKTSQEQRSRISLSDKFEFDWSVDYTSTYAKIPNIKMLVVTVGGGKIEGTINCDDTPVEGAKVSLSTTVFTETDSNGYYSFSYIPEGNYSMTITKHGFENSIQEDINIVAEQTKVVNVSVTEMPKYTVSGTVKNPDGADISNASITIKGYDNYELTTAENGTFTIQNVYKADNYSIEVTKENLASYSGMFSVEDKDVELSITLTDIPHPPLKVTAVSSSTKVDLTWIEPSEVETFRYDNGVISRQIGIQQGTNNSLMGSVHRTPAILNNMSWWTVGTKDAGGPHAVVNVFVIDLDEDGNPTSNILFKQMNVPNTDDRWTTFNFTEPIECPRGFMIALSYVGFLGIGVDSGISTEWPFIPNANYYTLDYTSGNYIVMAESGPDAMPYNFLIRAEGYVIGDPIKMTEIVSNSSKTIIHKSNENAKLISMAYEPHTVPEIKTKTTEAKSMIGYKVWRLLEEDISDEKKWTPLTSTAITTTNYSDSDWVTANAGIYKYAVKAVYSGNVMSKPYMSNMVHRGMESTVVLNISTNTPSNESLGAIITLTNNDNSKEHIYSITVDENGEATIRNVWKGTYKIDITLSGFLPQQITNVDIKSDTPILSYTMNELIVKPFNLEIVKTNNESERIFNWNAHTSILEDFERHENFEINSEGITKWEYIDADGSTTVTLAADFENAGLPMAYIVFNPSATTPALEFAELAPHSGSKYLASFSAEKSANNDYLISPLLAFPNDFTLSFWAKSFISDYGLERMKVAYSTNGNQQTDFTNLLTAGAYIEVPSTEWTKYSYNIPANAKHIAIQCVSDQAFMFMIDDIVIDMMPSKALTKYEIYLDENKVGETTKPTYTFTALENGRYTAGVRTIYTSAPTEMSTLSFKVEGVVKQYAVVYNNPENGTLTVKNGVLEVLSGAMVDEDTVLELTATPNTDYEIDTFTANGNAIINGSLTVTENTNISLAFKHINGLEIADQLFLNIYPNPVHNILNIEGEYTLLEMFNTAGKLVMTTSGETQINVSLLPSGIYIIKAYNETNVSTYKIAK